MKLIINNSSMQPIYEQIVSQIKKFIMSGDLQEGAMLPSVRTLSKELKVSALTAIRKGGSCGMSNQEITDLFQIVLEDQ